MGEIKQDKAQLDTCGLLPSCGTELQHLPGNLPGSLPPELRQLLRAVPVLSPLGTRGSHTSGCFLGVTAASAAQHLLTAARGCAGEIVTSVAVPGDAVTGWGLHGDTTSVHSMGAPSQWDVRLDGFIPGAAALFEAEVNLIYTEGVSLLTPAFWLPPGLCKCLDLSWGYSDFSG